MGRPLKPTALKKAQGTLRKCRENKNEPKFKILDKLPPPPKEFENYASEFWYECGEELIKYKILTENNLTYFKLACETYSCYKTNAKLSIIGLKGGLSPAALQANSSLKSLIKMMNDLGLTPASRARLNVPLPKEEDEETKKMKELLGE